MKKWESMKKHAKKADVVLNMGIVDDYGDSALMFIGDIIESEAGLEVVGSMDSIPSGVEIPKEHITKLYMTITAIKEHFERNFGITVVDDKINIKENQKGGEDAHRK